MRLNAPILSLLGLASIVLLCGPTCGAETIQADIDPVTREFHIRYLVPSSAPDLVNVRCRWSPAGKTEWQNAGVTPLVSETALHLADDSQWVSWMREGRLTEQRAAGLMRTVVFNPYPEAQSEGKVDIDFWVEITSEDPKAPAPLVQIASMKTRLIADNSDVRYIEDWSKVHQREQVVAKAEGARKWEFRTQTDPQTGESHGNALYGMFSADVALPQLSYPLGLRGWYAMFVKSTPRVGSVAFRLTGDERAEAVHSLRFGQEVLWQWRKLDRQQLVIKQPHSYGGYATGHVDYVKLVPLTDELVAQMNAPYTYPSDRLFAGYWEPYSWAFVENVQEAAQHRDPLIGFQNGGVDIIDIQLGRFGSKANYESEVLDQIISTTFGDPVEGNSRPTTDNVAHMQQFTNTLQNELQYCRELGLNPHANFGATACYRDTEAQGDFSKQHPEWMRGDALRYEVPEVRQHVLSVFREALEIGAPALSIDFCRYPEGIDSAETCTQFLRELKQLREEFARGRQTPIPLLIRFPAKNVRLWQFFDYPVWLQEGLVDYLCPSNIQGRHHHFEIEPYVAAVKQARASGSPVKLLPVVDGLAWGLDFPGPFLWRVKQLYDAGVDGIYLYQADGRLLDMKMGDRRTCRLVKSQQAVDAFWQRDSSLRSRASKGIYLNRSETGGWKFHSYERGRIWLEGVPLGEVELRLDGLPFAKYSGPPYILGNEEYTSDQSLGVVPHKLLVRVKDGTGWLEREFEIEGAP